MRGSGCMTEREMRQFLQSKKNPDKQFYLDLLDEEKQRAYEDLHLRVVMALLKTQYIGHLRQKILRAQEEAERLRAEDFSAENYRAIIALNADIRNWRREVESYKCFFVEPYFARMDLYDDAEGYNSYYIGKRGDLNLEIVDWRAPLARKYYQKSQIEFTINDYHYKLILRRAIRAANGKLIDFKNEYLSLRDYLTKEEIAGRDEEIIFDPYLKEILKNRKEQSEISDIIETIQEKQYEIITKPERDSFVLQGCAGSGKTMIMLHRLSFLMYNNESLRPSDILVITPSDSFNAFIDELSQVLELEKVKTYTLDEYYLLLLRNEDVDIAGKIDPALKPSKNYLEYIYSEKFFADAQAKMKKIYEGIAGMFLEKECRDMVAAVAQDCREQSERFGFLRNAGTRLRRAVLGEIKEKAEGGLYYTKPFRNLMNDVSAVEEFLSGMLSGGKEQTYSNFYRDILGFYRAASAIARTHTKITEEALKDLSSLHETVEKEISELRRYKINKNGTEVETYPERIAKRQELLKEIEKAGGIVREIEELFGGFSEFFEVLCGNSSFVQIGRCGKHIELARFFYKEIVRKVKNKYGLGKGLTKSDAYVLCLLLALLGKKLQPRFGLVFIDEGQDISGNEYKLLKMINEDASFNIYGDLRQNITPERGVKAWPVEEGVTVYTLEQNYRNTNQIVEFVSSELNIAMQPIGFDGPPVRRISPREISAFFRDKAGLKAVIVAEAELETYRRKSYNVLSDTGRISKTKINLMTVYESKGLEFTCVAVADKGLTVHERYIAYTRALKELAVIGEDTDAEHTSGRG